MSTIFVYLESSADTPLTGASPTLTYWEKDTPGAPAASDQAMTELVGGDGGIYFIDVVTTDGLEYAGTVDAGATAAPGTRYRLVTFSGTTDARLEVDIPEIHTALGLTDGNPCDFSLAAGLQATGIDVVLTVVGSTVTLTRQTP